MNKIKIENFIIAFILLILVFFYYICEKNANILFGANILICLLTCIKSKFSIFSLKSLLINYVLISIAFQYNTGESYGALQLNNYVLYYDKINFFALIYNAVMYIFIINTKLIENENKKMNKEYEISEKSIIFCCILAVIFSIVAFPSLKLTFSSDVRFQALLPGNGWNHIVVIALILVMPKLKSNNLVKATYIFCIAWFLLHGERVDMIGLLFCCVILFASKNMSSVRKERVKQYIKYCLIVIIVVFGMVCVGEARAKNTNLNFEKIIKKVLVQNTAADLGYVYNISIQFVKDNGFLYGKSYIHYLKELVPFINGRDSVEFILDDTYKSPGGAFILSEPYMNFGIFGILGFEILELYFLNTIIKSEKKYSFVLYLFIVATTFRTSWYGIGYIETGIVYILPILYVFTKFFNKRKVENE